MWNREGYTNTKSKSFDELKQDARLINVITSEDPTLKDQHKIAFVVSKLRGFEDYKKVRSHETVSKNSRLKLTAYSEDLLSTMFGGW